MTSIEGLRVITLDNVPINVVLENIPKPIRITGFDTSKTEITKPTTDKNKKTTPTIFTFSPSSVSKDKTKLE